MRDLEKTRNHARAMAADGAHGRECPVELAKDHYADWHIDLRIVACGTHSDHEGHTWMQPDQHRPGASWQRWCLGTCSGCVPATERELWVQIASEIDNYLSWDKARTQQEGLPI